MDQLFNMNWGKGIIIVMSTFVVFILTLVFTLMSNQVDLTSEDYYKREVGFQEEINAKKLGEPFLSQLQVRQTKDSIHISFKDSVPSKIGTIEFIRPSNQKLDKAFVWKGNSFAISSNKLEKGLYKIRLDFTKNKDKILLETEIVIQ